MSRDFRAGLLVGVVITILGIAFIGNLAKVFAEEWAVVTLGSQHLNGDTYCEVNPGLGIEKDWKKDTRLLAGFYRNSLCEKTTFYLGASWLPLRHKSMSIGFAGLGLTGYNDNVTLGAAMVLSYEGKKNGVNFVWFPSKKGDLMAGVVALQWKRRW